MVVSVNTESSIDSFKELLNNTILEMKENASNQNSNYYQLLGRKLENEVYSVMNNNAKSTEFEGSIELISGQKFPDIIAKKYYGVEVKTTQQNHWKSTGNSVLESTRVEGIERIFMFFGKMANPIDFRCRAYEECLSEVVVTHSPRYLIDMELEAGQTIFDKINEPYDQFRKKENPIKPIVDYYRSRLKDGEEVWWIDQVREEEYGRSMIIKFWNSLPKQSRDEYMLKGMILFPEVFNSEFNRFALWLYESESIICPNVRDIYTAGGTGSIIIDGKKHSNVPKVFMKLKNNIGHFRTLINDIDNKQLQFYWQLDHSITSKIEAWVEILNEVYKKDKLPIKTELFIKHIMG